MESQLDIGEVATLQARFVNQSGALADPTAIALTITQPDGTQTILAIGALTHPSTGVYSYNLTLTQAGILTHQWVASGGGVNVTQEEFLLVGAPDHDGPCDDWVGCDSVFSCRPASQVAAADRDYTLAGDAAKAASRILFLLSGRRYPGICPDTVRPCRRSVWQSVPYGWTDVWGSCGCESLSACRCSGISEIRLGGDYPVLGVRDVYVDGTLVPATSYRVDDDYWLVRTDGGIWPSSQDLAGNPVADPNTFRVRYWYGRRPPADGQMAAQRLAAELYASCGGTGNCSLPKRLQSISRQGETLLFLDPQDFLDEGRTGLYEVDIFLTAERHGSTHLGTVIASPEFASQLRRG